ncbi:trans-sulfuration enzyme family protein [Albibacterium bauzanense]|uniref:Cystathionine gamma-synthase n=1 Tax=Albibacterium bauzanense TaxID=653929 RepID=A0A4V6NF57_9SPHI|nr:aminotransferase class I/II-fold pyridoxal phosphate-dependent enzyme [Albibacterium bauzanense]TCK85491.1 cystathionine gamma-synthase [Albibacterium bauzanense]
MKIETIAIHAGNRVDAATGAVIEPITLSTTYERGEDGGYPSGYMYTRIANPNRASLENVLSKLEYGVAASAFSSGNAAGGAVFQALLPGSHVLAPTDMYHGLRNLLNVVYKGILEIDYVDMSDLQEVRNSIKKNTKLIWLETPSNPLLKLSDIKAITDIAKEHKVIVCCDNTFATPIFQNPLKLGADLVMHSTTKYLGGHSDTLGGALVTKEKNEFWDRILKVQELAGAVLSPFDCYLTVRGIKTLPYRMRGHLENAKQLTSFLKSNPKVEEVFYPDFGGMLSFLVKGGEAEAAKVANSTKIFTQATSLGGVESLIEHRATIEGPNTKTPRNLLRLSVGLENIEDLIEDINSAIN